MKLVTGSTLSLPASNSGSTAAWDINNKSSAPVLFVSDIFVSEWRNPVKYLIIQQKILGKVIKFYVFIVQTLQVISFLYKGGPLRTPLGKLELRYE